MHLENPMLKLREMRVHIDSPLAGDIFRDYFHRILSDMYGGSQVVVLCIGTDRSTGDSLGPLVGERLKDNCPYAEVFGNLAKPVHATNLLKTLAHLESHYIDPFIIAIDASLGRSENVGTIKLAPGTLKPGAGVNKDLPEVGNFHITGIVNIGGFMEYMVLQNTRLFTVVKMADIISDGIARGLVRYFEGKIV